MRIISQSFEILDFPDREKILKVLEIAGRTCYKSENKISDKSASR